MTRYSLIIWLAFSGIVSLQAQDFRVQIAAFYDSVSMSRFNDKGIERVFVLEDQNNIFRYYIGDYFNRRTAENAASKVRALGFVNAVVVDLEVQRILCGTPCPYYSTSTTYKEEQSDELFIKNIFFGFNSTRLQPKDYKDLDEIIRILRHYPQYSIALLGHTDAVGSFESNIRIASDRVRTIYRYFAHHGIAEYRVKMRVFGEGLPKADNNTESGRQYNRRVAMVFTESTDQVVPRAVLKLPQPTYQTDW